MKVTIKTIPHKQQRYDTVGDWLFKGDTLNITVSKCGNEYMELLVGFHELIEAVLCRKRGIPDEEVSSFDKRFTGQDPGSDPLAPYWTEHMFATRLEELFSRELGIDWKQYDKQISNL